MGGTWVRKINEYPDALVPLQSEAGTSETKTISPEQNSAIRILIADDQTIFRESLRFVLKMTPGLEVIGEAANGHRTLELIEQLNPDVLLLDLCMPGLDGLDVLREIRGLNNAVRVIMLCGSVGRDETVRAMQLGARGIVLKTEATESLLQCIRKVVEGDYWIGKDGLANLVHAVSDRPQSKKISKNKYGLTPREYDIIVAVLEGFSNPEIADRFSLSEQTVKHHLSHIFDKLGVYSRLELALYAVNHRILEAEG